MAWYHTTSGKRSLDEIANDINLGVGRRIHEMRFVNGVPMDQALDAVDKSVNYLNKDQIDAAYKKHINRTLSNGVEDPHEEAFMKSELTKTATVNFKKSKWYQKDPEQGNKDAMNAVLERSIHPDQYDRARNNGISHNEVVDFINIDKKNPYHRLNLHQYTSSRQDGASHEEAMEAAKTLRPGEFNNYAFGRKIGVSHKDIMEANDAGANIFGYVAGRHQKVPHNDMIEATKAGFPTEIYSDARANTNATHKQLMEIATKYEDPIDFNFYLMNRLKGLSHEKSLVEFNPNYNPWDDLLKEGSVEQVPQDEIKPEERYDAVSRGMDLSDYYAAKRPFRVIENGRYVQPERYNRATHKEVMEAYDAGLRGNHYSFARESGATHDEIMYAHNHGIYIYDYAHIKNSKITHDEIMDAYDHGIDISDYADTRESGATHNEILDAHDHGVNLKNYSLARQSEHSHEKALRKADSEYNPWNDLLKEAALKPGLDDWWETDPDEADIQQGQPNANWFDNWDVAPTYTNDDISRDIEQDTGRGPTGIGDLGQAWRIFNTPSSKNERIVQVEKRRRKFPDHFTIKEISSLLGIDSPAIRARIRNGKFPPADIVGTSTFRGDKGNLPALWHRDTIKDLVPLPDKPKENVKQETLKVKSAKEECGKEFPRSQRIYIPKDHYLGHECCEQPWTCTLSKGHEGQHGDMSHSNQHHSCPNSGNAMYYDPSSYWWEDAPNPYTELLS